MKPPRALLDSLNAVQDFVGSPTIKKGLQLGNKALGVASLIAQAKIKGPMAGVSAVIGIAGALSDMPRFGPDLYDLHLRKVGAEMPEVDDHVFRIMHAYRLFENGEIIISNATGSSLRRVLLNGKEVIFMTDATGAVQAPWGGYADKNLTVQEMLAPVWEKAGKLTEMCLGNANEYYFIDIRPLPNLAADHYIEGPITPEAIIAKFRRYRAAGIRKAWRIDGPPGSGKSTLVYRCAAALDSSMLVLTPSTLKGHIPVSSIIDVVVAFKPGVLLFEDVDRCYLGDELLSMLDQIRRMLPDTIVMSTVNEPKNLSFAARRPGRLGTRIFWGAPDLKWRRQIIRNLSKQVGLTRDISHLAEEMSHPLFTHDYVKEICELALVETDEGLLEEIRALTLEMDGDEKKKEASPGEAPGCGSPGEAPGCGGSHVTSTTVGND